MTLSGYVSVFEDKANKTADRKLLRTRSVINYSRSFGTLYIKNNFIAFLNNEEKK